MKSFSDRYSDSHHGTHETFADLVFCVMIVLVLFVMMLALEVSQRIRAERVTDVDVLEVESADNIQELTPEEVADLSERLQKQQVELKQQQQHIEQLQLQVAAQSSQVQNKIAALNGEQRFTGATEPASLQMAYNYRKHRFYFVRSKEFHEATTRKSRESDLAFLIRLRKELSLLAQMCERQRNYTLDEAKRIFAAFTEYQQINPNESGYTVSSETITVNYSVLFSAVLSGDDQTPDYAEDVIVGEVLKVYEQPLDDSDAMYPSARITVAAHQKRIIINGVSLSPKEFKDLLLAFGGRGVMLDFEGYDGSAPDWLIEEVLTPTGYIGKTPKIAD